MQGAHDIFFFIGLSFQFQRSTEFYWIIHNVLLDWKFAFQMGWLAVKLTFELEWKPHVLGQLTTEQSSYIFS